MIDDFLLRALLAGMGLMLAAGPLGVFVIWRRMAYVGDATSHAAILGVALALATSLPVIVGTVFIAATMALLVAGLSNRGRATDTVLGVLAHSALALGLVAVALIPGARIDLSAYLFGDILAVSWRDLILVWGGAFLVLGLLVWRWHALLTTTVSGELAVASGLNPRREGLILTLSLALVVAVSLKIVGALLVAAMLIVPAASARAFSRSPEAMAAVAVGFGWLAVAGGLGASLRFDTPAGPTIVAAAAILFAASLGLPRQKP
ncbi:MAG: metal ABC transporter permease [Rhodobacteraceae bacterium]|nr:metal ABC transporter permease [Paracoccaceae bacterium]